MRFAFSNDLGSSSRYFAAVLRQDAGWFDAASTGALTTKLTEYVLRNDINPMPFLSLIDPARAMDALRTRGSSVD